MKQVSFKYVHWIVLWEHGKSCSHFVVLRNTGSNTILPQLLPLGEEIQLSSLSVRSHTSPIPFSPVAWPKFLSEEWQLESIKAVAAEREGVRRRKQLHGRVGSLQLILLIFISSVLTSHQEGFKVSEAKWKLSATENCGTTAATHSFTFWLFSNPPSNMSWAILKSTTT